MQNVNFDWILIQINKLDKNKPTNILMIIKKNLVQAIDEIRE